MNIRGNGVMVDHVSTLFATDETISMDEVANNVTIQYSNISQGQNYPQGDAEGGSYTGHALGSLIQPGTDAKISVINNLYAHQKGRLPRVGTETEQAHRRRHRRVQRLPQQRLLQLARHRRRRRQRAAEPEQLHRQLLPRRPRRRRRLRAPASSPPAGGTGIFNGCNSTGTEGLPRRQHQGHQQERDGRLRHRAGQQRLRLVQLPGRRVHADAVLRA